jgi:hypothetical protein
LKHPFFLCDVKSNHRSWFLWWPSVCLSARIWRIRVGRLVRMNQSLVAIYSEGLTSCWHPMTLSFASTFYRSYDDIIWCMYKFNTIPAWSCKE